MPSSTARALDFGRLLGQEFVQRRIEQADRDREALHRAEDRLEVRALHRKQTGERTLAPGPSCATIISRIAVRSIAVEEHVFGPAEADALRAEITAAVRVGRGIGVDAHAKLPNSIGPLHQSQEVAAQLRRHQGRLPGEHLAGASVDRDPVALGHLSAVDGHAGGALVH